MNLDGCCASCDTGGTCDSDHVSYLGEQGGQPMLGRHFVSGLGELGFDIPDDGTVDPNAPNSADGSLDNFATVENLSVITPFAFAEDWDNVTFGGDGLSGLGEVEAAIAGANAAVSVTQMIEHLFKFGAGRKEADIITPQQNTVWDYTVKLSKIALASTNPLVLVQAIKNIQALGYNWLTFLSDYRFKDGRASAQAANTIMPYLDGSCGYTPHNLWGPMTPAVQTAGDASPCMPAGCGGCANAWPGNFGYGAGLVGALRRMAVDNGGQIPPAGDVNQGIGLPKLVFPGDNSSQNPVPQPYMTNPYGYFPPPATTPPYSGASMFDDTTTLGILAAVLLGGFMLSKKGRR
jgi:hypothetical protein